MPKLKQLKDIHWQAIEMKWKGHGYQEIAGRLGVSIDAVKSWFRQNGLLKQHYEDYAEDQCIKFRRKMREKYTKTH